MSGKLRGEKTNEISKNEMKRKKSDQNESEFKISAKMKLKNVLRGA